MKHFAVLALVASGINAFPTVFQAAEPLSHLRERDYAKEGCTISTQCDAYMDVSDAQAHIPATDNAATLASKARSNCGALGLCNTFDAQDQYVSTSGPYAYESPGYNDIRGPCPGLNAAANHGYIPRNGILNIQQTVDGLGKMYNMAPDLSAILAIYSIVFDGDVGTLQWSIGGPLPTTALNALTGVPQGNSWSHNNYEGDTSISRCDSYTNGGDAHSSSTTRFAYAYASANNGLYTMDTMARLYAKNTHRSIAQNDYYFAPLFSTTIVSPAAYNFVVAFMSNYSADQPGGYLDGDQFKSWFGMTGDYPNFVWQKGQERVPDNWYRRPSTNQYNLLSIVADLVPEFLAYPDTFRFGGNSNGRNTYTGIDINNVTGGVFNAATLLDGDNLACFFFQTEQQAIPLQLKGALNDIASATELVLNALGSFGSKLQCPELGQYDNDALTKYKGYSYKPMAPQTGPMNC